MVSPSGHHRLVVEMSEVQSLSAIGLGVVARAAREYAAAGGSLTLARPTSLISRVLVVTGLHGLLIGEPDANCDFWGPVAEAPYDTGRGTFDRISSVLEGVPFPAMRWQLVTHADYYGADHHSRGELAALPRGGTPTWRRSTRHCAPARPGRTPTAGR
jgi:hypothetical protein